MVEFGLIALLFVTMMFAIVEFGLLLNGWLSISSSAREVGRWAATGEHIDVLANKVRTGQTAPGVPASDLQLQVTYFYIYDWNDGTPHHYEYTTTCTPTACTGSSTASPSAFPGPPSPLVDPPSPNGVTSGATVTLKVTAPTYDIITPLVRPFFGCGSGMVHCYVPIASTTTFFYEGQR